MSTSKRQRNKEKNRLRKAIKVEPGLMETISVRRDHDNRLSYTLIVKDVENNIERNIRIYPLEYINEIE